MFGADAGGQMLRERGTLARSGQQCVTGLSGLQRLLYLCGRRGTSAHLAISKASATRAHPVSLPDVTMEDLGKPAPSYPTPIWSIRWQATPSHSVATRKFARLLLATCRIDWTSCICSNSSFSSRLETDRLAAFFRVRPRLAL